MAAQPMCLSVLAEDAAGSEQRKDAAGGCPRPGFPGIAGEEILGSPRLADDHERAGGGEVEHEELTVASFPAQQLPDRVAPQEQRLAERG